MTDFKKLTSKTLVITFIRIPYVASHDMGPFLRVTTIEVGLLTDFLKRRGELEQLDTTLSEYLSSCRKRFGSYHNTPVSRIEFEYPGMPTDEESVEALCNALPFIEAIKFQEDARVLRDLDTAIKAMRNESHPST